MRKVKAAIIILIVFLCMIIVNYPKTYAAENNENQKITFINQITNQIKDVVSASDTIVDIQCQDEIFYQKLKGAISKNLIEEVDDTNLIIKMKQSNIYQVKALSIQGNLSGDQMKNIAGIEMLTNLEKLSIGDTYYVGNYTGKYSQISDISYLSGLTNLMELCLNNNNISDISYLSGLTNLKKLYLNNNNISNISSLSELINLESLDIENNKISDISSLSNLTKLKELYLYNNKISDISGLLSLTNVKELHLQNNKISNISRLAGLTNVEYLNLSDNNISDISPLNKLEKLKFLYIENQEIMINTSETEIIILQIIKAAKEEGSLVYIEENYELENCELIENGNKIKINQVPATIKIKGGKADGTIVTINNNGIVGTVESETYNVEENIITKISPNTQKSDFDKLIESNMEYTVVDKNDAEIEEDSLIGTGYKLVLEDETEYILIVNGDVDGNGTADIYDMIKINNYRIIQKVLTEYEKIAADVDENGEIGIYDMIRINNYRITGKGV